MHSDATWKGRADLVSEPDDLDRRLDTVQTWGWLRFHYRRWRAVMSAPKNRRSDIKRFWDRARQGMR